jgi:hypothetical protein
MLIPVDFRIFFELEPNGDGNPQRQQLFIAAENRVHT